MIANTQKLSKQEKDQKHLCQNKILSKREKGYLKKTKITQMKYVIKRGKDNCKHTKTKTFANKKKVIANGDLNKNRKLRKQNKANHKHIHTQKQMKTKKNK